MITRTRLSGDVPNFSVKLPFDGLTYSLRFSWNERAERWYADIGDDSEVEWYVRGWLVEPINPVTITDISDLPSPSIQQFAMFGRFFSPGHLYAWSSTAVSLDTQDGLGAVDLIYVDQVSALALYAEDLADQEAA